MIISPEENFGVLQRETGQDGMVNGNQPDGVVFTLEELLTLFPLLKKEETRLNAKERHLLIKIEKNLYEHLSIADIENRLGGNE